MPDDLSFKSMYAIHTPSEYDACQGCGDAILASENHNGFCSYCNGDSSYDLDESDYLDEYDESDDF